jgi:hypothetical protein
MPTIQPSARHAERDGCHGCRWRSRSHTTEVQQTAYLCTGGEQLERTTRAPLGTGCITGTDGIARGVIRIAAYRRSMAPMSGPAPAKPSLIPGMYKPRSTRGLVGPGVKSAVVGAKNAVAALIPWRS